MMRRLLLLGAAVHGGLASDFTGSSVSSTTHVGCSAAYGSGGAAPTPLPTSHFDETYSSLFTSAPTTVISGVTRITAPTVTTTDHTSTVVTVILATEFSGTFTSWVQATSTIATATWPRTTCTNGVKPKTVTKYTGKYTPKPGQSTELPKTYPTQLFCTTSTTSFIHLYPTVVTGLGTVTTTPTVTIREPTTTVTSTLTYLTLTSPTTTVTSYTTTFLEASSAVPTKVTCEKTVTTTLDARCAPTNLVANHNNSGLTVSQYNGNVSVVYTSDAPYDTDPSLCCQLCLDNKGCGTSIWFNSGTCGLFYRSDASATPQCDFIMSYQEISNTLPGQGYIFAEGCGTIEYNKSS